MQQLVHERVLRLTDDAGTVYDSILIYGEPLTGGTWAGWMEFVSSQTGEVVRSARETTQSTLEDLAYWATGLEPVFFEGALQRATRRTREAGSTAVSTSPLTGGGLVRLRLETLDPLLPLDVMGSHTLTAGLRRLFHNGGVLVYEGCLASGEAGTPGVYEFSAQFGSDAEAAVLANKLWSILHGRGARLVVDGSEVPIANHNIKDALLGLAVP